MNREDIVNYLKQSYQEGAKFYIQKTADYQSKTGIRRLKTINNLKVIDFTPEIFDSPEGDIFIDYLLAAEKSGSRIFVSKPDKSLKRVNFTPALVNLA
ncbi:MAG: hypothetical protein EA365_08750 [Gloeocapsa sp. DLM2.Bin57]|nr:MAG: hypothetical protein EA365_08750 [Gloeocapsa sp. DLM2.Bin57]